MAINEEYLTFIQDQLGEFGPFDTKKMFGGVGFFREGLMFGMIGGGQFRLKVADRNRADFESAGMTPFMSSAKKKGMPYYEVPLEVIENKAALQEWADKAYQAAVNSKK